MLEKRASKAAHRVHAQVQCRIRAKPCAKCKRAHHTLLHADSSATASAASDVPARDTDITATATETVMNIGEDASEVLLKIVPITVACDNREIDTYALLDDDGIPVGQLRIGCAKSGGTEVHTKNQIERHRHLRECEVSALRQAKPLLLLGQENWELITSQQLRRGRSDPRYKTKFFNEVTKEKVESEIITMLGDVGESSDTNEAEGTSSPVAKRARLPEGNEATTSTRDNITSILSDILMSSDEDDDHASANGNVVDKFLILKSLVNEYNREKRIAIHEDPLMWWKCNTKFQPLYFIARQYLACPPGSVASEQLFSGAGLIYDPLRNRLEGNKASKLLFIKYNLLLLEQLNLI
ncbi:hypothetical protein EVAR_96329_1 [Eumeta japonica]|uniref:HAT C-terminal dimerisation domain-containing protein n=1 Tax=Eumeta variegata TaxID=151549 RepID=A0A4C1VZ06_EUMVA|nr:hypothetical protein EVAR_96329_1 [Eumeta japonica]